MQYVLPFLVFSFPIATSVPKPAGEKAEFRHAATFSANVWSILPSNSQKAFGV
jgi:hypothetical protein